jgi:Brp/Blh family beta-carotene 15,15'-monooxygenase
VRSANFASSPCGGSLWQTHGLPWGVAIFLLGFGIAFPSAATELSPWLFLSSAVLLGMPHGALDPWIMQWIERRRLSLSGLLKLLLVYVAVVAAAGLFVWQHRAAAVGALLLLTAWHWGTSDASGLPLRRPSVTWLLAGLARGAVLISAPLFFHRASAIEFLLNAATAPDSPLPPPWIAACRWLPDLVFPVAISVEVLVLAWIFLAAGRGDALAAVHGAETLLYCAVCARLPPEFAVGAYFIFFHSWRHLLRLAWLRTGTTSVAAIGGLLTQGWIYSLCGLLLLGFAAKVLAEGRPSSWPEAARAAYPLVLFALTVPHAALVSWIDLRESSVAPIDCSAAPQPMPTGLLAHPGRVTW